jgi:hypothetical protein
MLQKLPVVTLMMCLLCVLQGCNTFTFSPAVMQQLCVVTETETAAADFEEAAKRSLQHKLQQQ